MELQLEVVSSTADTESAKFFHGLQLRLVNR
jgi:hypothetical protein